MAVCASPVNVDDRDVDEFSDHDSCDSESCADRLNPSTVTDRYWVYCRHPQEELLDETYGKWLVFKPKASGALDEIWHVIRHCVKAKDFGDGCTAAKCSTALENADEAPRGSPTGVICVYTTKEAIDGNVNSVEWNDGMERWSGLLEWSTGLDYWSATPTKLFNIIHVYCSMASHLEKQLKNKSKVVWGAMPNPATVPRLDQK